MKLNLILFHYNPFQYGWYYFKTTFRYPAELRVKDDLLKFVPRKVQPRIFIHVKKSDFDCLVEILL